MELDPDNSYSIEKTYIYGHDQVLAQYNGDSAAARFYYLTDRLGSVRLIVDENAGVEHKITYNPYGEMLVHEEAVGAVSNEFGFTGQRYDQNTDLYCYRARHYGPNLMRFLSYDPVPGAFENPPTLHPYLYCLNNPINLIDPSGEIALNIASGLIRGAEVYAIGISFLIASTEMQGKNQKFSDALWWVGDWALRLTPVAVAYGVCNPFQFGKSRQVSHWPGKGELADGDWVMNGPKNPISYLLSGKWDPNKTNMFAPYSSGSNFLMEQGMRTRWPSGFWGAIKGFGGQRIMSIP